MNEIRYEVRGRGAWITLDRPDARNAVTPTMVEELNEALDLAQTDDAVRAVVLTGSGTAFCAGADLARMSQGQESGGEGSLADGPANARNPFADLLARLEDSPKPVIARIHGPAFGGGLGLVAAADVAIASTDAFFSFSEVKLGLVPAMISVVVLPKIGAHHGRRLFVTGRRFTAEEALDYGLVHGVVPAEELDAAVESEVAEIAEGGPEAVAAAKALVREMPSLDRETAFDRASELFAERATSDEGREGVAAFAEKRPPAWRA